MNERALDLANEIVEPQAPDLEVAPGRASRSAMLAAPQHPVESGLIQRKADGAEVAPDAEKALAATASSAGNPLPDKVQRKFEGSLGTDLSSVRVHTGSESADAAKSVAAKAYTVGQDIHFAAGNYDPESDSGQRLLAHEVAHTVQQQGTVARKPQFKLEVSQPEDPQEEQADQEAEKMVAAPSGEESTAEAPSDQAKAADETKPADEGAAGSGDEAGGGGAAGGEEGGGGGPDEGGGGGPDEGGGGGPDEGGGGGDDGGGGGGDGGGGGGDAPEVSSPGDSAETGAAGAVDAMIQGTKVELPTPSDPEAMILREPDPAAAPAAGAGAAGSKDSGSAPNVPIKGTIKHKIPVAETKIGKYLKGKGEITIAVEYEAKGSDPKAKLSKDGLEAELKTKLIGSDTAKLEGTLGDEINWKDKKFNLSGGLKLTLKGQNYDVETSLKAIPLSIKADGGVQGPGVKLSSKAKSKPITETVTGAQITGTFSLDLSATVEVDGAALAAELTKKMLQSLGEAFGGGGAAAAIVPAAMIATGALMIFQLLDTFIAADDLKNLVNQGPAAMAKAKQQIAQAASELKAGGGPIFEQLKQKIAAQLGDLPKELISKGLADKATPEALGKIMWPAMRKDIIAKAVASYRSNHVVESMFKDATDAIGSAIGAEKKDGKSQYGEDILMNNLNQMLPTTI